MLILFTFRLEILGKLGQNHGCWCPGSCHQVISNHDTDSFAIDDCTGWMSLSFLSRRVSNINIFSVEKWQNMQIYSSFFLKINSGLTRTTRMPAFWETPAAPWLPILVIHIRSQVKTRQSQVTNLKKIAKNSNFEILQETLHATHSLKLLNKMYKYKMDPTRTDGQTDRRTEWNQYTPQQLRCVGGIIMHY